MKLLFEILMAFGSISGAILMSLNIPDWSPFGYILFVIGSSAGIVVGNMTGVKSLTLMSVCFTIINVIGVYRWLM